MIARHIVGVDAVRAYRPGRAAFTQDYLKTVREKPEVLQPSNGDLTPHTLEVLLVEDMGKRFTGRRTFVEDLEQLVPYFLRCGWPKPAYMASPASEARQGSSGRKY